MFGKAKGSSHEKHEQLPPAPQPQESPPANWAQSNLTEICPHRFRHDNYRQDFQ